MFKEYIRKADIVLFIVIMILGLASTVLVVMSKSEGSKVTVTLKGKLYGTYNLLEDRTIEIRDGNNTNTVSINKGKVSVEASNCHNQVCVKHSEISKSGESIICLPHKLVVEVQGRGGGFDAVSI